MSNRTKNSIYTAILILSVLAVYLYRKNKVPEPIIIEGNTMGTTYHITYFDSQERNFKFSIDSVLRLVNRSINTYDSTAEVSIFNKNAFSYQFKLPYFLPPLETAREIYLASNGAFDPTVMPLVNGWGFGFTNSMKMDSAKVDSIKVFVGLEKIEFNNDSIWKSNPYVQLDFGGIGQGYGADVIASLLKSKDVTNMLVELGGEGMACGINLKSKEPWKIGILDPNSTRENQFFKAYVSLRDKSFTTSGNYFNYREIDGRKFSHTIDPDTGFPVNHALLSASVFTKDATSADAWGTAFMVMGREKAIKILESRNDIDALLMYSDTDGSLRTYVTDGIQSSLIITP